MKNKTTKASDYSSLIHMAIKEFSFNHNTRYTEIANIWIPVKTVKDWLDEAKMGSRSFMFELVVPTYFHNDDAGNEICEKLIKTIVSIREIAKVRDDFGIHFLASESINGVSLRSNTSELVTKDVENVMEYLKTVFAIAFVCQVRLKKEFAPNGVQYSYIFDFVL